MIADSFKDGRVWEMIEQSLCDVGNIARRFLSCIIPGTVRFHIASDYNVVQLQLSVR